MEFPWQSLLIGALQRLLKSRLPYHRTPQIATHLSRLTSVRPLLVLLVLVSRPSEDVFSMALGAC
jgi:hypothetical protein